MDASGPRTIRPPLEETSHPQPGPKTHGDPNTLSQSQTLQPEHQQIPNPQTNQQRQRHQNLVVPTFFEELTGTDGQAYISLRKRVTDAYRWHTYQYWFVGFWSNALLFIQIVIAASLTVLGSFKDSRARTASIFLGATNTVIAGLLTYFKSRNQPNRARQFRNDLAKIVDQLDDAEANFRDPNCHDDPYVVMQQIRQSYNEARTDAQANYPDLWVKTAHFSNPPKHRSSTSTDPPTALPRPQMVHIPGAAPVRRRPTSDPVSARPLSDTTIRVL